NPGSPGVVDSASLANDRHFHLARVLERLFDFAHDVARQAHRLQVVDLLWLDDNAHLATSLDRERFLDTFEGVSDLLERFESTHVVLDTLASRTRSSA